MFALLSYHVRVTGKIFYKSWVILPKFSKKLELTMRLLLLLFFNLIILKTTINDVIRSNHFKSITQNDFNNTKLRLVKRYFCTSSAHIDIASNSLDLAISITPLDSSLSVMKLVKSFSDLETPTTCDLMNKLNEITDQLSFMYNSLDKKLSKLTCDILDLNFQNRIISPINQLETHIKALTYSNNYNDFFNLCKDPSKGVVYLFSEIKAFINRNIESIIRECSQYKPDKIDQYFELLITLISRIQSISSISFGINLAGAYQIFQ